MAIRIGTGDDDLLKGTLKDDIIRGLGGDDAIDGRAGNDIIIGGRGDDLSLRGGSGNDMFVFSTGDGTDQIQDYELGKDGLDVDRTTFGIDDLQDVQIGGKNHDSDHDGNFVRETSANGKPETILIFGVDNGFQEVDIIGITLKQLIADIKNHPDHYSFF